MTKKKLKQLIKEEFENLINHGAGTMLMYEPRIQKLPKMKNLSDETEWKDFGETDEFFDGSGMDEHNENLSDVLNSFRLLVNGVRNKLKKNAVVDEKDAEKMIKYLVFLLNRLAVSGVLSKERFNKLIYLLRMNQSAFFKNELPSEINSLGQRIVDNIFSKYGSGSGLSIFNENKSTKNRSRTRKGLL